MKTRYQEKHYEDVAGILNTHRTSQTRWAWSNAASTVLAKAFADLFAADNPPGCIHCNKSPGVSSACRSPYMRHHFEGGFDREQFLAACGLES
jgi:hypothetical protein